MALFASTSSSQVPSGNYEVFISFRGSDVRFGFLSHLKNELRQKNIDVYVDDRLERGEEISLALVEAIERSMIALVIFSKDYASSKWCLEELVKIIECKEAGQQIVIPIFYDVDPSDVRHQRGTYEEALTHHEQKLKDNVQKLQIWKSVLEKTANLAGYHSSHFQEEYELVNAIVEGVLRKVERNDPIVPKSELIGFHQNFISVESLMEIESPEVRILGIWGPGGIGKTTLASTIFDKFSSKFQSHCFLQNVREESTKIGGLSPLYQKLLSELLDQKDHINMNRAVRRLKQKKVLIVLDDVDNPEQLKDLARKQPYLGRGSRVIATSRDKHALKSGGIHEKYIHEVKELNEEESLELFCTHAFNQSHPNMGYEELSKRTVAIAKGIPLALQVLGSHFYDRDEAYWESELRKVQNCPRQKIQDILKVSYDGLDPIDRNIFLDIAFFFCGTPKR
ncbi:TMV resistance protein N-like [Neltuma alba]|uniref:TMV resistance protein N-like n=1 Tax=Neltuma alba TaxID=207710 RepID=UPI0010A3F9EB|nr:TMV resistance protein N-like [Prosopis alba]